MILDDWLLIVYSIDEATGIWEVSEGTFHMKN